MFAKNPIPAIKKQVKKIKALVKSEDHQAASQLEHELLIECVKYLHTNLDCESKEFAQDFLNVLSESVYLDFPRSFE